MYRVQFVVLCGIIHASIEDMVNLRVKFAIVFFEHSSPNHIPILAQIWVVVRWM